MKDFNWLITRLEKNLLFNFRTFLEFPGALLELSKELEEIEDDLYESNKPYISKFLATMLSNYDGLREIKLNDNKTDSVIFRLIFNLLNSDLFLDIVVDVDHCQADIAYLEDAKKGCSISLADLSEKDLVLFEEITNSFNVMLKFK
jgi:hypothetical protein